ncbi:hypothetical protein GGR57DRAFT_247983 [Xylariaceae sp. FL1272]|nr:hypothetical protein GGR57DRAFT_247983 [Xylariaceae sp. FL1272]
MLSFNPLKFFVFPFVFLVALPLSICAGITTILAFLVLFLRLFLVYFDVGLETLRYFLLGHKTQTRYGSSQHTSPITPISSTTSSPLASPDVATFKKRRRRKRNSSSGSGSLTPNGGYNGVSIFTSSVGLDRDFEGIGGWRLDSVDVDTSTAEEQQWYNLNSRLEVPQRHHFRSRSGGAVLTGTGPLTKAGFARGNSPEGVKFIESVRFIPSPNGSISRTPTINKSHPPGAARANEDGYFPIYEGKHLKKVSI